MCRVKKLKPQKVDWAQIERFLQSAEKKLASAHKSSDDSLVFPSRNGTHLRRGNLHKLPCENEPRCSLESAFQVDGCLIICGWMRLPRSSLFCESSKRKHFGVLTMFDRPRRKRNMALYDDTGLVSHHDVALLVDPSGPKIEGVIQKGSLLIR
ncbi:MAG: hypothetical protein DMG33_17485 [Acidobacteria bacterium]|nr:MAG: hypothetical protein DMG33_17485 [Acidobacteriota bacterium]